MDRAVEASLVDGARAVGAPLSASQVRVLDRYLETLLFWNRRINLTAVRDPALIATRHFVDSLAVVPHVPADARRLVDVGSGGGFPGAVVALMRPDVAVLLVESSHKKAAFLRALHRELPLPNLSVESRRIEDLRSSPSFLPFDVAVSRATWELPEWLAIGQTLVLPGGLVIGMEGATEHPLPSGYRRVPYPLEDATRSLVLSR